MLILQWRFFLKIKTLLIWFLFLFLFFLLFYFRFFFFNVKDGTTPLYMAAQNGYERIVEILLKKGNPNVDLATDVLLFYNDILNLIDLVSFLFFTFSFFYFFYQKDSVTPLCIAVRNGHEQIVQILLEKGNPNVDLPTKV